MPSTQCKTVCTLLQAIVAHVNMVVSAFSSEAFISNADAVLAAEDARAAAENSQCAISAVIHYMVVMP